jgi:zinc resistance-associated protein
MMGPGYGPGMMGPGYGPGMMGPGYGHHRGWWGDNDDSGITREQADKLETLRDSFYRETRNLRDGIYDRQLELRRELSKETPDRSRLQNLQKEISKLTSELDQKGLEYRLQTKKIAPEVGDNFAGGSYGPGAGACWR